MSMHLERFRSSIGLRHACVGAALAFLSVQAAMAASGGAGASPPFTRVEASVGRSSGGVEILGSAYNTLAGEASQGDAVTLDRVNEYIEFTVPAVPTGAVANAIVIRYSIPAKSPVIPANVKSELNLPIQLDYAYWFQPPVPNAPRSLVWGTPQSLTFTNKYSHYYGQYPFSSYPPDGNHHHFYDEVSFKLPRALYPGDKIRLTVLLPPNNGGIASPVTVDFVDFELMPQPTVQPANSISVTQAPYSASASCQSDATAAIQKAFVDGVALGRTVWIPSGRYCISNTLGAHRLNGLRVQGAGMWYTTLTGVSAGISGGVPGIPADNVFMSGFKIDGVTTRRCDVCDDHGIKGVFSNSLFSGIWIEHKEIGVKITGSNTVYFNLMRIRDTTADGVNFMGGVTNSLVVNSHVRNTGDDGLAMWSNGSLNKTNTFDSDTVELPILANGIAIYGGQDTRLSNNRVIDAGLSQGGGIHVGNRNFGGIVTKPLAGTTTIVNNSIIRSGNLDPNWGYGVGAFWLDARALAMNTPINVSNLVIQDSLTSAMLLNSGDNQGFPISNVTFDDVRVQSFGNNGRGVPSYVLHQRTGGSATFRNVLVLNTPSFPTPGLPYVSDCNAGFVATDGGGNLVTMAVNGYTRWLAKPFGCLPFPPGPQPIPPSGPSYPPVFGYPR